MEMFWNCCCEVIKLSFSSNRVWRDMRVYLLIQGETKLCMVIEHEEKLVASQAAL